MQVQILYGKEIKSQEELHQLLAEKLQFPDHYGCNLDALYDCLCERREALELIIEESAALQEQLSDYAGKFFRVLQDASEENAVLQVKLV